MHAVKKTYTVKSNMDVVKGNMHSKGENACSKKNIHS